jgi:hypothetical protein
MKILFRDFYKRLNLNAGTGTVAKTIAKLHVYSVGEIYDKNDCKVKLQYDSRRVGEVRSYLKKYGYTKKAMTPK